MFLKTTCIFMIISILCLKYYIHEHRLITIYKLYLFFSFVLSVVDFKSKKKCNKNLYFLVKEIYKILTSQILKN